MTSFRQKFEEFFENDNKNKDDDIKKINKIEDKKIEEINKIKNESIITDTVWNAYIGKLEGSCYTCNIKISPNNFACGCIKSIFNGGEFIVDNLRPLCPECHYSLGPMDLHEFIEKIKSNNNDNYNNDNYNNNNNIGNGIINYGKIFYITGNYYRYVEKNPNEMLKCYAKAIELNYKNASFEYCWYYLQEKFKLYIKYWYLKKINSDETIINIIEKLHNHINNLTRKQKGIIYAKLGTFFQKEYYKENDNIKVIECYEKSVLYGNIYGFKCYVDLLNKIIMNECMSKMTKNRIRYLIRIIQKGRINKKFKYVKNIKNQNQRCYICNNSTNTIGLSCDHKICLLCYLENYDYNINKIKCRCGSLVKCKFIKN